MSQKPITIYVTSRALSLGIIAVQAKPHPQHEHFMVGERAWGRRINDAQWYSRGSYRLTLAEAIERAEEMQRKRIVRMEKQLAALRALNFEGTAT